MRNAGEVHLRQRAESDCGVACVAMVMSILQPATSASAVYESLTWMSWGVSALDIVRWAQASGLHATGVAAELGALHRLPMPSILHWKMRHFVVLAQVRRGRYLILDPALAGPVHLSRSEVARQYSGHAIIFGPLASEEVAPG